MKKSALVCALLVPGPKGFERIFLVSRNRQAEKGNGNMMLHWNETDAAVFATARGYTYQITFPHGELCEDNADRSGWILRIGYGGKLDPTPYTIPGTFDAPLCTLEACMGAAAAHARNIYRIATNDGIYVSRY